MLRKVIYQNERHKEKSDVKWNQFQAKISYWNDRGYCTTALLKHPEIVQNSNAIYEQQK